MTYNHLKFTKKPPEHSSLYCLDARSATSLEAAYDLFSQEFNFPNYFGRNPHALIDCLTETFEEKAFDVINVTIENSQQFLYKENNMVRDSFFDALEVVGEELSKPVESGEIWDRKAIELNFIFVE